MEEVSQTSSSKLAITTQNDQGQPSLKGPSCVSKCGVTAAIVGDIVAVLFVGLAMAKMFGSLGSHAHVGAMIGGGVLFVVSTSAIIFIAVKSCKKGDSQVFQLVKSEKVGNEDGKSVYITHDGAFVTYPRIGDKITLFEDKGKSKLAEVPKEYEKKYVLHSFDNTNMVVASNKQGFYKGIFLINVTTNQYQELGSQETDSDGLAISGNYIARASYLPTEQTSTIEIWSLPKKEVIGTILTPLGFLYEGLVIVGDKLCCISNVNGAVFPKVASLYSLPDGKLLYDSGQESKDGKGQFLFQSKSLFLGENVIFEQDGFLKNAKTLMYSLEGLKLVEIQGTFNCLNYDKTQNLLVLSHKIDNGATEIVFWSLTENKSLQKLKIKEKDASIRGAKFIGNELFLYGSVPEKHLSYPFIWKFEPLKDK